MKIGNRAVGPGQKTWVIAEIGVNHDGDLAKALELVHAAKDSGADAVKIQYFSPSEFVSPSATYKGESQIDLFSRYALQYRHVARIAEECREAEITFFGTPDSVERGRELVELGAPVLKVGSDDLVNHELVAGLAGLGKPMILSTGMGAIQEVVDAWSIASKGVAVALLHCVSQYPTPTNKANLQRMLRFRSLATIGYSDHTDGIMAVLASVAMGASIVECHFTLDRKAEGPDHAFSKDPEMFADMVAGIRQIETLSGTGEIDPGPEEMEMRKVARRSIVAACDIPANVTIERGMLCFKRPGTGFMPYEIDRVAGRVSSKDIKADDVIRPDHLC